MACGHGAGPLTAGADEAPALGAVEALRIATEAYIYGYPLVTFEMARRQQTNVAAPDAEHAPMGQMIKMRTYPAVDNHCCSAPNADTLYTEVWLDVSKEPWILGIPDMGDRYYIVPMLDGWSEVFKVASPSTTGSKAQTYAITGPGWKGTLPKGVTPVKSSTGMVWVLGRIYSTGTPEDYQAVHALQDKFTVVPLSAYGKPYTPPPGAIDPTFDMKTAVRKQVNALDIEAYFSHLATLMKTNPPTARTRRSSRGWRGSDWSRARTSTRPSSASSTARRSAWSRSWRSWRWGCTSSGRRRPTGGSTSPRAWATSAPTIGCGAWPISSVPAGTARRTPCIRCRRRTRSGDEYDGEKHKYVVRFEKGQLPPADAFWSLTMYDGDFFFVPNPINRYDLAQRDKLITNPDGSVDLYLQAESPGPDKEANWLPAPKGKFVLVQRIYAPRKTPPSILDGSWAPPPVRPAP